MNDTITISSSDSFYTGGSSSVSTVTLNGATGTTGINYTATPWASSNTVFNGGNGNPLMTIPNGGSIVQVEEEATLDVKGNLVINGRDLEERLKTIEKVLQIPERDVRIEEKHPKLKKLYDEYIHALAKYRTFEAIKGDKDAT
jgi:hypothetical protein